MAREFSSAFYHSDVWAKQRRYIRKRDHYKCQRCGAIGEEVHHIIPLSPRNISDPYITLDERNLTLLCHACHMEMHASLQDKTPSNSYEFDANGQPIPPIPR